jgi:hypothetical protein
MSADNAPKECAPSGSGDCPLPAWAQTRNLVLFGANVGLIYLASPVLYVGKTAASLCAKLGASEDISNLPSSAYFFMTPLPILIAWLFPHVRMLKPVLVVTYVIVAGATVVVVATLLLPTPGWMIPTLDVLGMPPHWVVPAVILHGGLLGWALGVVATYQWEVLGRGVAERRRGQAFSLAFGVGPILAVIASLGQQLLLDGKLAGVVLSPIEWAGFGIGSSDYLKNFATLFATVVPIMGLAALLALWFIVPQPPLEVARQPFVSGVFGGLGEFFGYRIILFASIAMVLVCSGYNVLTNISLFTKVAVGEDAAQYVGYQSALQFGFKVVAGLLLGWLLTRTHPKAGMLVTGAFCLASVAWVMVAPGMWFLLSFGLMGVGELFGVYYPNYIFSCSAKSKMRRNMAFTSMLNMPSSFSPVLFGFITKKVAAATDDKKLGFQISFLVSIALLSAALVLVQVLLPARPRPRKSDMDASDLALETADTDAPAPAAA